MRSCPILALLAVFLLTMTGCNQSSDRLPLEEIPNTYSLEQAKEDGCVTHENGVVTQGKDEFETFYADTMSGKKATIRLAFYYTLDDPSRYDPDYYKSIEEDYPVLYLQDLSFDGEGYTIHWYEEGEEIIKNYSYLMKYSGQTELSNTTAESYVRYVLTNDDTVTWEQLLYGIVSSRYGAFIDHHSVCTDLVYD